VRKAATLTAVNSTQTDATNLVGKKCVQEFEHRDYRNKQFIFVGKNGVRSRSQHVFGKWTSTATRKLSAFYCGGEGRSKCIFNRYSIAEYGWRLSI